MKIVLTSVLVDDQAKALQFYTEVLGFVKKDDIPLGGDARWLTLVSKEEPNGTQLLLEPDFNPVVMEATKNFKKALFDNSIPWTSFAVKDVQQEYERIKNLGVSFKMGPTNMGPVTIAVLNDTCGNWIQVMQYN